MKMKTSAKLNLMIHISALHLLLEGNRVLEGNRALTAAVRLRTKDERGD